VWISIQSWLVFRALRAQAADPDPDSELTPAAMVSPTP
jgi:hypothetical protein